MKPQEIKDFSFDNDRDHYPVLEQSILQGINNSLILIAKFAQYPWQKQGAKELLDIFGEKAVQSFLERHGKESNDGPRIR